MLIISNAMQIIIIIFKADHHHHHHHFQLPGDHPVQLSGEPKQVAEGQMVSQWTGDSNDNDHDNENENDNFNLRLHFQLVDTERDPRYEGGRLDQPALKIRFLFFFFI